MKLSNKSKFIIWLAVDAVLLIVIIALAVAVVRGKNDETPGGNSTTPTQGATVPDAGGEEASPDETTPSTTPTPVTNVVGWNEHENGKQYVDEDNNLLMSTKKTIDGNTYFFDEKGYVRTGWYTDARDGETYYLGTDGVMVKGGNVVIDGVEQAFDENGKWRGKAADVAPTATPTPTPIPTTAPTSAPTLDTDKYSMYSPVAESWWYERMKDHVPSTAYGYDIKYSYDKCETYYINKNVAAGDKVIYLTFDCGYENGYTGAILDTLKKHNAQATFFVTKSYIRDAADLVKRMKEEGHFVGNHTCTHPNLGEATTEKVIKEITDCADYMKEKTGYTMDPYLRPPEGAYSERSLHITMDLGYKTILWSLAYADWDPNDQPGKQFVIDHFTKYHHNGGIPLIHVVSESNMQALDEVLTMLENEGYRFGSLSEL